mgnify:CR=1 FL=1
MGRHLFIIRKSLEWLIFIVKMFARMNDDNVVYCDNEGWITGVTLEIEEIQNGWF